MPVVTDASVQNQRPKSHRQDANIQPQTPVFHIPGVELQSLIPAEGVTAHYLSPACQTWQYLMSAALLRCVTRQVLEQQRPGPDQAHITSEHIPELRKFIEAGASQELPDASKSLLIGQRGPITVNHIRHGTKLIEREGSLLIARPPLPKQDGTTQSHANREGNRQEDRRQQDRCRNGCDYIEHSLHGVALAGQVFEV